MPSRNKPVYCYSMVIKSHSFNDLPAACLGHKGVECRGGPDVGLAQRVVGLVWQTVRHAVVALPAVVPHTVRNVK